ncbi:hypothetical protein MY1884_007337 [Beauveria asiatica]
MLQLVAATVAIYLRGFQFTSAKNSRLLYGGTELLRARSSSIHHVALFLFINLGSFY